MAIAKGKGFEAMKATRAAFIGAMIATLLVITGGSALLLLGSWATRFQLPEPATVSLDIDATLDDADAWRSGQTVVTGAGRRTIQIETHRKDSGMVRIDVRHTRGTSTILFELWLFLPPDGTPAATARVRIEEWDGRFWPLEDLAGTVRINSSAMLTSSDEPRDDTPLVVMYALTGQWGGSEGGLDGKVAIEAR